MSRFKITLTKTGKCDIYITLFNQQNSIMLQYRSTFDVKPTVKELKELYLPYREKGAKLIRITTTPSRNTKTYKL